MSLRLVLSAGCFCGLLLTGTARANTVSGSIYRVTDAQASAATPATVASLSSGPIVTFDTTTPINFASGGAYTIGEFINSDGGTTVTSGSGNLGQTLNDTLFNFTGQVTVTNGETFTAGHDDGLTLVIDGMTVIDAPGPTGFDDTTETYTGPSGTYNFQLVYGECCGAPAALAIDLPFTSSVTPEPSSLLLLSSGLLGMGAVVKRRVLGKA